MTPEERRHATPEWQAIAAHLPDPATSTPQRLELQGDVLRARKFPNEALQYYRHALNRGGDPGVLLNKIGVTEMDLSMDKLAELDFKRAVKLEKKNSDAWNNLASLEYSAQNYYGAAKDFQKAVRLSPGSATFHSNLANAYFQGKMFKQARKEFSVAMKLDPHVFDYHGSGGVRTQLQSPKDRGRLCYEMARIYAAEGVDANVLHWLAASAETGFDVMDEMRNDASMQKYRKDPRVVMLVKNIKSLHDGKPGFRSADAPMVLTLDQLPSGPPAEASPR